MVPSPDAFRDVARLLLPRAGGRVVPASQDWAGTRDVGQPPAVWGALAQASGLPVGTLLRRALARERALRSLGSGSQVGLAPTVRAVHPLAPSGHDRGGLRGRARSWLLAGVAAELRTAGDDRPSLLEAALQEAGAQACGPLHAGSGGGISLRVTYQGRDANARIGLADSPGDPGTEARALGQLEHIAVVPRVLRTGVTAGERWAASWLIEEHVPGRTPSRVGAELVEQVAATWADLPRAAGPPRAHVADLGTVNGVLPGLSAAWEDVGSRIDHALDGVPAILRHGDLWRGNLLVDRGRLSGVVDWDAWSATGTPGTDLLQLVATEVRHDRRWSLGSTFASRPWLEEAFAVATDGYWRRLELRPDPPLLEAVGRCWWLAEVAGTLRRHPERAADPQWVHDNVESVLTTL